MVERGWGGGGGLKQQWLVNWCVRVCRSGRACESGSGSGSGLGRDCHMGTVYMILG